LFLSRLRKVLPHLLPLLSSSFSALTFQVSHTSSYLHFPFVLLLVLPTLPLLSPSWLNFFHIAAADTRPSLLLYALFLSSRPHCLPGLGHCQKYRECRKYVPACRPVKLFARWSPTILQGRCRCFYTSAASCIYS
jgi:hypothetical protein